MSNAGEIMCVGGASRYKYFEKPLVPNILSFEPVLDPSNGDRRILNELVNEPVTKTIGIQTQCRESEAQTEPYSPHYRTPDSLVEPEILTLQNLTYGSGLPVGPREIARICRNRERREKEAQLPPITDEEKLKLHKAFLEEQERLEFQFRERELGELLQTRFQTFQKHLYLKYEESERRAEHKIAVRDSTFCSRATFLLKFLGNIRIDFAFVSFPNSPHYQEHQRQKIASRKDAFRQVTSYSSRRSSSRKPKSIDMKKEHLGCLSDAATFSSQPDKTYDAKFKQAELFSESINCASNVLSTAGSILLSKYPNAQNLLPKRQVLIQEHRHRGANRQALALTHDLQLMDKIMKRMANVDGRTDCNSIIAEHDENVSSSPNAADVNCAPTLHIEPPSTPSVLNPHDAMESEWAIKVFQRIIRGKSIQRSLQEGKEGYLKDLNSRDIEDKCVYMYK